MSLKCMLGLHDWNGCVCRECNKTRDQGHNWSGNCEKCSTCGMERHEFHLWENDRCSACGKERDMNRIGSFIDPRDRRVYRTVRIGDQTWMAENLVWLPCVTGSADGSDTESRFYVYGYEGTIVEEAREFDSFGYYGVLYNWPAALEACPPGWHLPSDEEWKILERFEGMSPTDAERINKGERSSGKVGAKLKSGTDWGSGGNGLNTHGFTALPGGYRGFDGGFADLGEYASFWSSTEYQHSDYAWARYLDINSGGVFRTNYSYKRGGFSVRCVKND
jgi:uncharacterized protein (TIGR02145 family)